MEFGVRRSEGNEAMAGVDIETISLGANNSGSFGPGTLDETQRADIATANASGEYIKPASQRWICIDGRLLQAEWQNPVQEANEADPQIAGGIVITDTAAELLTNPSAKPLSETITLMTAAAIRDGLTVTVHGDDGNGKGGCAANAKLRPILQYMGEQSPVMVPLTWSVLEKMVLAGTLRREELELIQEQDVELQAKQADVVAADDEMWDATPAEVVDRMVAHGAQYLSFAHDHAERNDLLLLRPGAFDKARFVRTLSEQGAVIEQFAVSFGEYARETVRRGRLHGESDREVMLKISAALLYNLAALKALASPDMQVDLVG